MTDPEGCSVLEKFFYDNLQDKIFYRELYRHWDDFNQFHAKLQQLFGVDINNTKAVHEYICKLVGKEYFLILMIQQIIVTGNLINIYENGYILSNIAK